MAADLSQYKEAIANAYEGRAVRDAIVAMVQAVEDAINAGGSGLDTRVSTLEGKVDNLEQHKDAIYLRLEGIGEHITSIENTLYGREGEDGLTAEVSDLDTRVTALEGGGNT